MKLDVNVDLNLKKAKEEVIKTIKDYDYVFGWAILGGTFLLGNAIGKHNRKVIIKVIK